MYDAGVDTKYDLDAIKFSTDEATFERVVGLYESGKVTRFKCDAYGATAVVIGSHRYEVVVSASSFDEGSCTCYLGQKDVLCKHMVATALYAACGGRPLSRDDKQTFSHPMCSGRIGALGKEDVAALKKLITITLRYIKPYRGPSRTWFRYQGSLQEGCARLSKIVGELPVSGQTADILVDTLLRLDRKLSHGGIDDSDGTVGSFIEGVVAVLQEYAHLDPACVSTFEALEGIETCFEWEEPLVKLLRDRARLRA